MVIRLISRLCITCVCVPVQLAGQAGYERQDPGVDSTGGGGYQQAGSPVPPAQTGFLPTVLHKTRDPRNPSPAAALPRLQASGHS